MDKKEKEKLILLESSKIFISLQFLKAEETECLTDYGKGLLGGLLDPDTEHKIPVVHRDEYNKLLKKYDSQLMKNCELRERPSEITELRNELLKTNGSLKAKDERIAKLKETIDNLRAKKPWWSWIWETPHISARPNPGSSFTIKGSDLKDIPHDGEA